MKKTGWLAGLALGAAIAFAPALVHADEVGVGLNVNLGADDAAHFDFGPQSHHEHRLFAAAQNLQNAKHTLWNAGELGPHKREAIHNINLALDWLRWAENHHDQRRHGVMEARTAAQNAKRALWHARGPAKRDAMGSVNQALDILNHLAHRY